MIRLLQHTWNSKRGGVSGGGEAASIAQATLLMMRDERAARWLESLTMSFLFLLEEENCFCLLFNADRGPVVRDRVERSAATAGA